MLVKLIRKILFPVVPIYYLVTWFRNKLYDNGVKSSKSYDFPVICVGNLSVGGTGKTPMIEYLIRLLKEEKRVATLSRGYKRITEGFVLADENATADKALRLLLSEHCQLSVVVDEFGSVVGVLAMEDIIESMLGQEIFEYDDMAIDMRELAKKKHEAKLISESLKEIKDKTE